MKEEKNKLTTSGLTHFEDVQDLPFTKGRAFTSSLLCSTGPGDLLCAGWHRTGQHKGLTGSVVFDQGSIGVVLAYSNPSGPGQPAHLPLLRIWKPIINRTDLCRPQLLIG
jgi:hypothetical protein